MFVMRFMEFLQGFFFAFWARSRFSRHGDAGLQQTGCERGGVHLWFFTEVCTRMPFTWCCCTTKPPGMLGLTPWVLIETIGPPCECRGVVAVFTKAVGCPVVMRITGALVLVFMALG